MPEPARIRRAKADDAAAIHELIVALAVYEREPDAVEATPAVLAAQMREPRPPFECLLAERDGRVVGFALTFRTYSTWRGRQGVWLEDLFVREEERGRGTGAALLRAVAAAAVAEGAGKLEFSVLDWNEPARGFYRALGAKPLDEWTVFRVTGDALDRLAAGGRDAVRATAGPPPIEWITIPAPDLDAAAAFYAAAFGFEITPFSERFRVFRAGNLSGGLDADLVVGPRGVGFSVTVPDLDAALRAVADHGGRVVGEPFPVGPGGARCARFADPNGNVLELYSAAAGAR